MNQASHSASDITESSINAAVRIIKIASCQSLSGRSTLTYHVGNEASGICLRVFSNSGSGFFSKEWVELSAVQNALEKVPDGIALTAHVLSPIFQGKSANNQSFLFAVLKHEGLVSVLKDSKGLYERADATKFMDQIGALLVSGVDLKVDEPPAKVRSGKSRNSEVTPNPATPKPPLSGKKSGKKAPHTQGKTE